ncbi:MAG: hypothetical protein ABH854_04370 [Candidatus Diapherotrites archaeon]|nr:hypothetical protein [Candidatus Micrarchaeota archaeon]MBU1939822.1 hypothetical protein [Candidatus Micrarchaeota archaeon]
MELKSCMIKAILALALLFSAGMASADIDVNVVAPNTALYISQSQATTYDINFTVRDLNNYPTDMNARIYLSTGIDSETDLNHIIVSDLNLMGASTGFACVAYQGGTDYNFRDANQMCKYTWTPADTSFPDGNWIVDINVHVFKSSVQGTAANDFNQDRDWSDLNFMLDNSAPTCSIASPADNFTTYVTTVDLSFPASDANGGNVLEYYIHNGTGVYLSNGTTTTTTWTYEGPTPYTHTYYMKARDQADNNCTEETVTVNFGSAAGSSGSTTGDETTQVCGDGICTGTESEQNCPQDCVTGCGNMVCESGESCSSCVTDCGKCQGDDGTEGGEGDGGSPGGSTGGDTAPPVVSDPCAKVICADDGNPCTNVSCYNGECRPVAKANNTSCGYGKECVSGTCLDAAGVGVTPSGPLGGLDMTTVGIVVVLVIIAGGGYMFFVKK